MNDIIQQKNIVNTVLHRINTEEVSMHSKMYVRTKVTVIIALCLAIVFLSISLFSFVLFNLRQSSSAQLLFFGTRGWSLFATVFPWMLVILDIACIFLLEVFLRQFSFGYRRSFLSLLILVLVGTFALAVAVDQSRLNDDILVHARNRGVPIIGSVYDSSREPLPLVSGACRCVVRSITPSSIILEQEGPGQDATLSLILPAGIATSSLFEGEHIFIIGNFASNTISADYFSELATTS